MKTNSAAEVYMQLEPEFQKSQNHSSRPSRRLAAACAALTYAGLFKQLPPDKQAIAVLMGYPPPPGTEAYRVQQEQDAAAKVRHCIDEINKGFSPRPAVHLPPDQTKKKAI